MNTNKDVEKLIYEKIYLEKKLKRNKEKLEPFVEKMKAFCLEKRLRRVTWAGFEIVYSPKKKYFTLKVKTSELHKTHPELLEEKEGYERLKITETK